MVSFKCKRHLKNIILMSVRWYLAYALSCRDIEALFKERGLNVDHSSVNRWVREYSPQLFEEFKKKRRPVGHSWRMDETYIKVNGQWMYQYRAVDKIGHTIDCFFSAKRDKKSALRFFKKAIKSSGKPVKITVDKSGSNFSALQSINASLPEAGKIQIRQIKYLNNLVEQDHRFIKKIVRPMMGFKSAASAKATLLGIELHHMLRKGQHVNSGSQSIFEQFYSLAA